MGTSHKFEEDLLYAEQHGLCLDRYGRTCLDNCHMGLAGPESVQEVRRRVEAARAQAQFGLRPPFAVPPTTRGQLVLGQDQNGRPIHMPLEYFGGNVEIRGNTGCGKTTFLKMLIVQLATLIPGMMFFEMYKQDLRHLMPLIRGMGRSLVVLTPGTIKLNLLQADCDVRRHLAMITDLLARSLQIPPVAVTILNAVCHQLYVDFGIYAGRCDAWPTLYDVYEAVYKLQNVNKAAQQALLDRLARLLLDLTPAVAAWRLAWRPQDLAKHCHVIELGGCGERMKTVVVSYYGFSLLYGRIERGASNAAFDLAVGIEDAQRFLSDTPGSSDIPCFEEMAALIRGTGVSLIASVQSGQSLRRGLTANLGFKLLFRCGDHQDYAEAGGSMGLDAQAIMWAKLHLRPGIALGQFSQGDWRQAFVLRVHDLPDEMKVVRVKDDDVLESQRELNDLPTIPANEFAHWQPRHYLEITATAPAAPGEASKNLSERELAFLEAILDHPLLASSTYAKQLKLNGRIAREVRDKLISLGYVKEHKASTGVAGGRSAQLLEPLPAGYAVLGRAVT